MMLYNLLCHGTLFKEWYSRCATLFQFEIDLTIYEYYTGKVKNRFSTRQTHSFFLFTKECQCKDQGILMYIIKLSQIYTLTSKDFSKTDLNWLIKNGKLTSRNKYVCNICTWIMLKINFVKKMIHILKRMSKQQ